MQKEQACLGRNRDPNLVGQLQTAAALKSFLSEKNLHVTEQFRLILGWEPAKKGHIAGDDRAPLVRHRLSAQMSPPPLAGESKHGS
jgi:hypothetical protein